MYSCAGSAFGITIGIFSDSLIGKQQNSNDWEGIPSFACDALRLNEGFDYVINIEHVLWLYHSFIPLYSVWRFMTEKVGEDRRRVKTADNIFDILQFVQEEGGAGVSEIASNLDLAKSTVHEYLYTLTDRGYLVNQNGSYHLGLILFEHGSSAKNRYDILPAVQPGLEQLMEETGEVAWFIVEEQGLGFYLTNVAGEHSVQTHARVGKREHLHCLATGKVIMAHMPDSRVSEIIERHGLPEKTPYTITDFATLRAELDEIKKRGYTFNQEEAAKNVSAIAAPILTEDEEVIGGICVSGPARRMERKGFKSEFPEMLLSVADEISLRIDWQ